jgi:hypothetical protein
MFLLFLKSNLQADCSSRKEHIAHMRQEYHNSKFGIFELLVYKETFADTLLTGIVS